MTISPEWGGMSQKRNRQEIVDGIDKDTVAILVEDTKQSVPVA